MKQDFAIVLSLFFKLKAKHNCCEQLLAETTELLRHEIAHYDWVGFYRLDPESNTLLLGPYSGKTTEHSRIPVGKGICGQVAENKRTMVVQDVSEQTNYISCSMDVQSEIVVPIFKNGQFVAEIDIDSHTYAPFSPEDEIFLKTIAAELADCY